MPISAMKMTVQEVGGLWRRIQEAWRGQRCHTRGLREDIKTEVAIFPQLVMGLGWAYIHQEYTNRLVQVHGQRVRRKGSGISKEGSYRKDDTRCETMGIDKRESLRGEKKRNWTVKCRTVTAWRALRLSDIYCLGARAR